MSAYYILLMCLFETCRRLITFLKEHFSGVHIFLFLIKKSSCYSQHRYQKMFCCLVFLHTLWIVLFDYAQKYKNRNILLIYKLNQMYRIYDTTEYLANIADGTWCLLCGNIFQKEKQASSKEFFEIELIIY